MCVVGNANTAGLSNSFEPRCDVDPIAEDVVLVENDITDVNADPKLNSGVLRDVGVLLNHASLNFNGTAHRIYCAGKLDEHSVASRFNDTTPMSGYCGIDEAFLAAFSRASVLSSSAPIRRL